MNWMLLLTGLVIVVGLMQAAKSLLPLKSWVGTLVMVALSFLVALVLHYLPAWVVMGLAIAAVAQLAYENVVKLVGKLVDRLGEK